MLLVIKKRNGVLMKQMLRINLFSTLFLLLIFLSDAFAIGLGFNLSAGGGGSDWETSSSYYSSSSAQTTFSSSDSRSGLGIIFDTNVSRSRLFNYRLNIGYENIKSDIEGGGVYEMDGWYATHDFGFAIIRNKKMRLWIGPELRFSNASGGLDTNKEVKVKLTTFAIGAAAGANFHIGENKTFSLKLGALSMEGWGRVKNNGTGDEMDLDNDGGYVYINASIIFRFRDQYLK